jgi:hypothetical protein
MIPGTSPEYLQGLERELALCQGLLSLVLDHLGRSMGPGDRNSPLGRVLAADDPVKVEEIVVEVDQHLAANRQDLALRLLREETGLIYDELYGLVARWGNMSAARKRGWLRFRQLQKAVFEVGKKGE